MTPHTTTRARRSTHLGAAMLILATLLGLGILMASRAHAENVISSAKTWSSAATSNTDIFAADVSPANGSKYPASAWRLTIALVGTDSVVNVQVNRTVSGTKTAQTFALNGGTALTAGNLYTFSWGAEYQDGTGTFSYNVQAATTTTAGVAFMQEVQ